jgi:hypothetical protein
MPGKNIWINFEAPPKIYRVSGHNTLYQPVEKKASLEESTKKRWWSSIPSAFYLCVEQYLLILWSSISWTLWSSIPNQFQKSLGYKVVKQWVSQGIAQGLHRGRTRGAQGVHKERTGGAQCTFSPAFLLFKIER